jgi:hypothetical protein
MVLVVTVVQVQLHHYQELQQLILLAAVVVAQHQELHPLVAEVVLADLVPMLDQELLILAVAVVEQEQPQPEAADQES